MQKRRLDRHWVIKGCLAYTLAGIVLAGILSIKDTPGEPLMRFTLDEMRPFLAGLATYTACLSPIWDYPTFGETWDYNRLWSLSFFLTLSAGMGIAFLSGHLSKEQVVITMFAIIIGSIIGIFRATGRVMVEVEEMKSGHHDL